MRSTRKPLVSIIMPTYNSEKTIYKSIESVINQTYDNIELVIVDGASRDDTIDIVNSFADKWSGVIKVISEPDNGIYDAMNKGICLARGELIGILSSNDTYVRDAVENIVKNYSGNNAYEILYGMQRYMRNGKEIQVSIYHHTNLPNKMMAHPSCFVTKKTYEKYGNFNADYKISADYEFLWRMYDNKAVVFTPVYCIVAEFNEGGASGTQAGYLETTKLRYKKGQLSRYRYTYIQIRCRVGNIIRKLN